MLATMEVLWCCYGAATALPPPLRLPSGDLSGRQSMNPAISRELREVRLMASALSRATLLLRSVANSRPFAKFADASRGVSRHCHLP